MALIPEVTDAVVLAGNNSDVWSQYGTIIISAVVSLVAGVLTFLVTFAVYKSKVDNLVADSVRHESEIKALSKELTVTTTKLDERTKSLASTLTQSNSPLSLSPTGEDLLKRSGADAFVLKNQDELVGKIKDIKPTTAYDVQVAARKVVESLSNDERFKQFKNFVYNEGMDLEPIFIVMSLYLRDIALPLLDFKPEDIDITDPNKSGTQTAIPGSS